MALTVSIHRRPIRSAATTTRVSPACRRAVEGAPAGAGVGAGPSGDSYIAEDVKVVNAGLSDLQRLGPRGRSPRCPRWR